MPYRFLATSRTEAVEYLTLNRPDVRNAFNDEVVAELAAWAAEVRDDRTLRAVVLAGAGRAFCAGADAAWMSKAARYTVEENINDAMAMSRMFHALDTLPVPLIAKIHGAALGGGAGLAAVCDIAIAEDQTLFGFTEVKLGIVPAVISPFVLAKIGRSAARDLFLTGARFGAARALEVGLVHAVVPSHDLDRVVADRIHEILTAGSQAVNAAKALVREVWGLPLEEAISLTARTIANRRASLEGQEGLNAFLERRKPSWIA